MEIMGDSARRSKCRSVLFLIDVFEPEGCRLCPCVREGTLEVIFRTLLSLERTSQPFRWQYCLFDSSLSPLQSEKRVRTVLSELQQSLPPVIEDGLEESTRRRPTEPRLKNRKGFWASDLAQLKNLSADATAFFKSACSSPGCTGAKQVHLPCEPESDLSAGRARSTEDLLMTNIWRGLSGLSDAKYSWSHEDASRSPVLASKGQGEACGVGGGDSQPSAAAQGLGLDYARFLNHVVLVTAAPGVPAKKQQEAQQPETAKGWGQRASGGSSASARTEVVRGFQSVQTLFSSLKLQLCWSLFTGASAGDSGTNHCPSPSIDGSSVARCRQLAPLRAVVKQAGCRERWSLSCMECVRRSCMEGEHRSTATPDSPSITWSGSLEAHVTSCLRHALVRPVSGLHQLACKASFFLQPQDLAGDEDQAAPSPVLLCTLPPMSQANPQPRPRPPKAKDEKEERGRERECWREPKPMPLTGEPSIFEALSFLKGGRHKSLGALSLQLSSLQRKDAQPGDGPMLRFILTTREGKEEGPKARDQQLSFLLFIDFLRQHQLQACVQVAARGGSACRGLVEWYAPGIAILSVRAPPKDSAPGAIPMLRSCSTAREAPAAPAVAGPVPGEVQDCFMRLVADRAAGAAGEALPEVKAGPDPRVAPEQARGAAEGNCGMRGGEVGEDKCHREAGEEDKVLSEKEGVPSDAEQVQGADSQGGAAGGCQSNSCGAKAGNAAEGPAEDAATEVCTEICNGLVGATSGTQDQEEQEEQGPLLPINLSQQDRGETSVRCSEGGTAPGKAVSVSERQTGSLQGDQAVKRKLLAHMHFDELVLGEGEDTCANHRAWETEESEGRGQGGGGVEEEEEVESAGDWCPTKENPYDDAFLPGTQMSQTPTRRPLSPAPAPLVLSQTGTRRRRQEGGVSGPRGASWGRDAQHKVLFVEVLCKMQGSTSSLLEAYQRTKGSSVGASAGPPGVGSKATAEEQARGGCDGPGEGSASLEELRRSLSHLRIWLKRLAADGEQVHQPAGSFPHLPPLELEPPPGPPEQSSQRDSHQGSVPPTPAVAQAKVPERHFQSEEEASALLQSIPGRIQTFMASSEMSAFSLAKELVSDCIAALGFLKACKAEHGGQTDGSAPGRDGEAGDGGAGRVPSEGKGAAAATGGQPGGLLGDAGVVAEARKRLLMRKKELQDKYRGCKEEHKLSGSPTGPFTLADKVREFELQILLRMCLLSSDDPEVPANQCLWKPASDLLGMLSLCREGGVYAPDLDVYAGDLLWKRFHESFPRMLAKMYEYLAFDIPQPSGPAHPSPLVSPTATGGVPSSSFPAHAFDCAMSMGGRSKAGTGAERSASGVPQRTQRSGEWSQGGSQGGGERSVQGGSVGAAAAGGSVGAATASSRGETKLLMQGASSRRMALLRQVLPAGSSQPAAAPAALPRSGSFVSGADGPSASRGAPREHPRPPVKARANPRKSSQPKHYPQSPPMKAPAHQGHASKPVKTRTSHGSAAAARQEAESLKQQQQARARWGPLLPEKQGAPSSGTGGVGPVGDGKRKRPEGGGSAPLSGSSKKHRHEHRDTSRGGGSTKPQATGAGGGKGAQTDVFAARAGTFLVSFLEAQQGKGTGAGAEKKEKPASRASSAHTKGSTHTAASSKAAASSRGPSTGEEKSHRGVLPATHSKAEGKEPSATRTGEAQEAAAPAVLGLAAPQKEAFPMPEPEGAPVTGKGVLDGIEPAFLPAAPGGGSPTGAEDSPLFRPVSTAGELEGAPPGGEEGAEVAGEEGRDGGGAPEGIERAGEDKAGVDEAGKEKGVEEEGKTGGEEREKRKEKREDRGRGNERTKRARQRSKLRRKHPRKQRPAVSDGTVLGPESGFPPEDEHEADSKEAHADVAADRIRLEESRALLAVDEGKGAPGQGGGAGTGRGPGAKGLSKTAQQRLFSKWHAKSRQKLWKPAPLPDLKKASEGGSGAAQGVPQPGDAQASTQWGQAGPFAMLKGKSVPPEPPAAGQAGGGGEGGSVRADPGSDAQQQQQQQPPAEPPAFQQKGSGARQRSRKPAKPLKGASARNTKVMGEGAKEAKQEDPVVAPGLALMPPPSVALLMPPPASAAAVPNTATPSIFSLLCRTIDTAPAPAATPGAAASTLDTAEEKPTDSLSLLTSLQALRKVAPSAPHRSATAAASNAAAQQQEEPASGGENNLQLGLVVTSQRTQASPLQSVPVNTATACKEENLRGTKEPGGDSPEKGGGGRDHMGGGTGGGENKGTGGGGAAKASATRRGSGAPGGGRRSTRSGASVPAACLAAPATSPAADEEAPAEGVERAGDAHVAQGPANDTPASDEAVSPDCTPPAEGAQPSEEVPGMSAPGSVTAATAAVPSEADLPEARLGSPGGAGPVLSSQGEPSSQEEYSPGAEPQRPARGQGEKRKEREGPEQTSGEQQRMGVSTRRQKEQERLAQASLPSARTRGARSASRRDMLSGAKGRRSTRGQGEPDIATLPLDAVRRGRSKRLRPDAGGSRVRSEPKSRAQPGRRVSARLNHTEAACEPHTEGKEAEPGPSDSLSDSGAVEDRGLCRDGSQESLQYPSAAEQQLQSGQDTVLGDLQAGPIMLGESVSCSPASTPEDIGDNEVKKGVCTGEPEGETRGDKGAGKGEEEVARTITRESCAGRPVPASDVQKGEGEGPGHQDLHVQLPRGIPGQAPAPLSGSEPPSEPTEYLCFSRPWGRYVGFMLALPAPAMCLSKGQQRVPETVHLDAAGGGSQSLEGPKNMGTCTGPPEAAPPAMEEPPAGAMPAPAEGGVRCGDAGAAFPATSTEVPAQSQGPQEPAGFCGTPVASPGSSPAFGTVGAAGEEGPVQEPEAEGEGEQTGADTEGKEDGRSGDPHALEEALGSGGTDTAAAACEPGPPLVPAGGGLGAPEGGPGVAGGAGSSQLRGAGSELGDGQWQQSGSSWDSWGTEEGGENASTAWCGEKQGGGSKKVYTRKRRRGRGQAEGERGVRKTRRATRALGDQVVGLKAGKPSGELKAEGAAMEAAGEAQASMSLEEEEDALATIDKQGALMEVLPGELAYGLGLLPMLEVYEACEQQEMEAAAMMEYECTQRAQGDDTGPDGAATPRSSLDLGPCKDHMQGAHDGATSLPSGDTEQGPEYGSSREEAPDRCATPGISLACQERAQRAAPRHQGHQGDEVQAEGSAEAGAEGVEHAPGEGEGRGPEEEAFGLCLGSQGTEQSHTVGAQHGNDVGADAACAAAPASRPCSPRGARHAAGAPQADQGALPADSLEKIADALCPSEDALGAPVQGLAASWPGESTEHGISSSADAVPARLRGEEECQSHSHGVAESPPPPPPLPLPTLQHGLGDGARLGEEGGNQPREGGLIGASAGAKQGATEGAHHASAASPGSAEGRERGGEAAAQGVAAGHVTGGGEPPVTPSGAEQQRVGGREEKLAALQQRILALSEEGLARLLEESEDLPHLEKHVPVVPSASARGAEASVWAAGQHCAEGGAGCGVRLLGRGLGVASQPEQGPEQGPQEPPVARVQDECVKLKAYSGVEATPTPMPRAAVVCMGDAIPPENTVKGKQEQPQTPLAHRLEMEAPTSTERSPSSGQPSPAIKARKQMTITALFKPSPKGQERRPRGEAPLAPT